MSILILVLTYDPVSKMSLPHLLMHIPHKLFSSLYKYLILLMKCPSHTMHPHDIPKILSGNYHWRSLRPRKQQTPILNTLQLPTHIFSAKTWLTHSLPFLIPSFYSLSVYKCVIIIPVLWSGSITQLNVWLWCRPLGNTRQYSFAMFITPRGCWPGPLQPRGF